MHLLLQCHFCRNQLPNSDYGTDTKSVMDQAIRILQAMIDVVADAGWLATTLRVQNLMQMIIQVKSHDHELTIYTFILKLQPLQGRWAQDSSLLQLPHVDEYCVKAFRKAKVGGLPELMHSKSGYEAVAKVLREELAEDQIEDVFQVGERILKFAYDAIRSGFEKNCQSGIGASLKLRHTLP